MKKLLLISIFSSGCISIFAQGTLTLTTSNTPATNCTAPCNGTATVTNVTGGTPPYTYLWNVNPPQQTQTANNLCPGQYQVGVFDASTPFPNSGQALVTITCVTTGVNNTFSPEENITLFPNPANNELNLQADIIFYGNTDFTILNILGMNVYSESFHMNGQLNKTVNISSLPSGVYSIEFSSGSEVIRKKFIKQ